MKEKSLRLFGLPAIVDSQTRILILGTFPGPKSLRDKQYYAQPKNQFWKIMEKILGKELANREYTKRLQILLKAKIGLWDVYESCERANSSDSKIRNPVLNDFEKFHVQYPLVRSIYFNGQKAAKQTAALTDLGLLCSYLYSSSSACAIPISFKVHSWTETMSTAGLASVKSKKMFSTEMILDAIHAGRRESDRKVRRLFITPQKKGVSK